MANENQIIIGAGQDTAHRAPKINTITCGDCLEVMQEITDKSVDMILCDLPYGTTQNKWDIVIPFQQLWEQYTRICKGAIVLTASQPFTSLCVCSNLGSFKYEIIWEKNKFSNFLDANKKPMKIHENILVFGTPKYNPVYWYSTPYKRWNTQDAVNKQTNYGKHKENVAESKDGKRQPVSIITFNRHERPEHPTQKPVAMFEYLIRTYTNEGDTVLDNCIGSGTTAIACINTGRNYIGIEKEEKYCRIAEERIHALRSPAQNTKEICHTAPNSRVTQGAEAAHIAEAATS